MANKKTEGKSKRASRLLTFLLMIFAAVFIGSGFMLGKEMLQSKKEKDAFEQMNSELEKAVESAEDDKKSPEEITLEDVLSLSYTNGRVEKTYMFIPEESGTYRFTFDGAVDNGGYSIYCEDDIDDSFSNGSGEFEAIAGKVYYITLTFCVNAFIKVLL